MVVGGLCLGGKEEGEWMRPTIYARTEEGVAAIFVFVAVGSPVENGVILKNIHSPSLSRLDDVSRLLGRSAL